MRTRRGWRSFCVNELMRMRLVTPLIELAYLF
jgi:hypothetical protein